MTDMPSAGDVRLVWALDDSGALSGWIEVRNSGAGVLRVSGKPGLVPLGMDGSPLPAECLVTLELRTPGHVDIPSGGAARAQVGWAGWDGPPASGEVAVTVSGGSYTVVADGPAQPTSRGPATNLWSSWFELVT